MISLFLSLLFFATFCVKSEDDICGQGQWPLPHYQPFEACKNWPYPRQYINYYTSTPPEIDGLLNEQVWEEVAWTEEFIDILGHDAPKPRFQTRAKMRWDDDWIYVAALMEEPQCWANLTERNEMIFHDNAFEVFFDPAGTTHYYKEFQINANNAIWDLCMNKPYLNGGYANYSGAFDPGFDMTDARTAVWVNGTLNDPAKGSTSWSVEIALPIAGLMVNQSEEALPKNGTYWRTALSRVEYQVMVVNNTYQKVPDTPPDYWLWQPQGVVNIHLPERWGYVQFSTDEVNTTEIIKDPNYDIRYSVTQVYYSECQYFQENGQYTPDLNDIFGIAVNNNQTQAVDSECADWPSLKTTNKNQTFVGTVKSYDGCHQAQIDNNRYLTIKCACGGGDKEFPLVNYLLLVVCVMGVLLLLPIIIVQGRKYFLPVERVGEECD